MIEILFDAAAIYGKDVEVNVGILVELLVLRRITHCSTYDVLESENLAHLVEVALIWVAYFDFTGTLSSISIASF